MNHLLLVGINHQTAPVSIREQVSFSEEESRKALLYLLEFPEVCEAFFLSTCNRTEILAVTNNLSVSTQQLQKTVATLKSLSLETLLPFFYVHKEDAASRHLFQVAAGLDSMVLGEPQILGQVKKAFHLAIEAKASGAILNRLLHRTFFVAKKIRTETGIGSKAISISYVAIELARKIFDRLSGQKVLLIGAGEMAELAIIHLRQQHCGDLFIANQTFERALQLADRFQGAPARLEEIPSLLEKVDIIISSTGSPDRIVSFNQVKSIMKKRRNRPLFFIDIAVPRDIDPDINRIENVYVYDLDDLQKVAEDNLQNRQKEAIKAQSIVEEAVVRFKQWLSGLGVIPVIIQLRKQITQIVEVEVEKSLESLLKENEGLKEISHRMTEAIVSKLIYNPVKYLKKPESHHQVSTETLSMVRDLFDLKE